MKRILSRTILVLVVSVAPLSVFADMAISEIMYDLPGGDDGREWIEIVNTGSIPFDLSSCKFREGGTSHSLAIVKGDIALPPGSFAVIADVVDKFLADWPGFSGTLFDSGKFSLLNTGETLEIVGCANASVSYTSNQGAKEDGNSLQLNGTVWSPAAPTPGAQFSASSGGTATSSSGSVSSGAVSEPVSSGGGSTFPTEPQIRARIKGPSSVVVGAESVFVGEAWGLKGEPLETSRFLWSFGDGTTQEGQSVVHPFFLPGEYLVVLSVSSGQYENSARLSVTAVKPSLSIPHVESGADGYVTVHNGTGIELDLSFWQLESNGKTFTFPKNTMVRSGTDVQFANRITGLSPILSTTKLLYPNGSEVVRAEPKLVSATIPKTQAKVESRPSVTEKQETKSTTPIPTVAAVVEAFPTRDATSSVVTTADAETDRASTSSMWYWYVLLGGIAVVASAAYWIGGRASADEFTIVEDTKES